MIKIISRNIIALITIGATTLSASAQKTLTNSIGMELILIGPGSMTVGEFKPPYVVPEDTVKSAKRPIIMAMGEGRGYSTREFELARQMATADSKPGFKVTIKRPYYIGKYEVTQGQWKKVMGSNPSTFKSDDSDNLPVESITWDQAQAFVAALNKMEKTSRYRLPTEFEWEYAARAGRTGDIPWPDIQKSANLNKKTTHRVGEMAPNAWGLYDVLGNVWEWVDDFYNENMFADPVPQKNGKQHVLKGASFTGDVKNATYMTHAAGPGNGWDIGLRILMEK